VDRLEFAAKTSSHGQYQAVWHDLVERVRNEMGEPGMADYLMSFDNDGRAAWHSGICSIPVGFGTYVSNSLERLWYTLKYSFDGDLTSLEPMEAVTQICLTCKGWSSDEFFDGWCLRFEAPIKPLTVGSSMPVFSERLEDGTQCRRLTAKRLMEWQIQHGDENTFLKEAFNAGSWHLDVLGVMKDIQEAFVMPKYRMEWAADPDRRIEMQQALRLARASSRADVINVFDGIYSYSKHNKLVTRYAVVCIDANNEVYDLHPHFAKIGQTEHSIFIRHIKGIYILEVLPEGPKKIKRSQIRKRTRAANDLLKSPSPRRPLQLQDAPPAPRRRLRGKQPAPL